MVDWSKLPEELLGLIAVRLFSVVELLRFRSTCTSWRSSVSVADICPFPIRPLIHLNRLGSVFTTNQGNDRRTFLSRASFFRVTLSSSSSSQGWLIKYDSELDYGKLHLLNPLSRLPLSHRCESIDLGKLKVSEIRQAYTVRTGRKVAELTGSESIDLGKFKVSEMAVKTIFDLAKFKVSNPYGGFRRLVLVGNHHHRVLGIGCDRKIWYWNGEIWSKIKNQVGNFRDVIVHGGLTYALDSDGVVWWISSSLDIFRYGPSLYEENICKCSSRDLSLVECCGELYIVQRLVEYNLRKRKASSYCYRYMTHDDAENTTCEPSSEGEYHLKTVGFKVYKMDEESGMWVQVMSLGENAFVMATDACVSVLSREFYGCLQSSIYFSEEGEDEIKVFNLDDGSFTTMSGGSQSCFQMFVPSFH